MSFNFGSLANSTNPVNNNSYLKPYTINDNVSIKSTDIQEGTSSEGNSWKRFDIVFGNDEGTYKESIFFLTKEEDFIRKEVVMGNGGKRYMPSNWERTRDKLAAIGYAFFPEGFENFKKASGKFKDFEELIKYYKALADKALDKTKTNMKLVGRNNNGRVYATLPSCTGIAQATEKTAVSNNVNVGDWYTWLISPFGNNLSFTSYEETQKAKINEAKPTTMPDEIANAPKEDEEEFDLASLL